MEWVEPYCVLSLDKVWFLTSDISLVSLPLSPGILARDWFCLAEFWERKGLQGDRRGVEISNLFLPFIYF